MAYRKILVPLTGAVRDAHVLAAAFEVAKAFGSHVAGVFVRPDPSEVLPYLGEGVSAGVVQEIMDASRASANRAAAAARATLDEAARKAGAATFDIAQAGTGVGVSFHVRDGLSEDVVAQEARLSDLVVFDTPADAKDVTTRAMLESALLNGRKPLLLVPHKPSKIVGAKAAIGWDGGAAAAHAVSAAIPLLSRAEAIEILNVTSGPLDVMQMDRLRDYLRLQGLTAAEHGINPGSQGTATALIDGAMRAGAGLLVIGGYGHSRLREFVLGGVTRHVFANVTMPILMAH
ncbi:MAG: universal stress protein [Alphaproteobacteria bacterium]|nr:universal stress protein [Alphaproteobacteria bacterium]